MENYEVSEVKCRPAEKFRLFLENFETMAERERNQKYIISLSCASCKILHKRCNQEIYQDDPAPELVAKKMLPKLDEYLSHVFTDKKKLATVLNPRFSNFFHNGSDIFRPQVKLLVWNEGPTKEMVGTRRGSVLKVLLDEQALDGTVEGEVIRFVSLYVEVRF